MESTLIDGLIINFAPESSFITFPDFNNLSLHTTERRHHGDDEEDTTIDNIKSLISRDFDYVNEFGKIKKGTVISNSFDYIVDCIDYQPVFLDYYPRIPVIKILKPDRMNLNQQVYKDTPLGIFIDEITIIPYAILIPILRSLINNNGVSMLHNLKYEIVMTNVIKKVIYFIKTLDGIKIGKFNLDKNSLIYSINKQPFNKNGSLYCPQVKLFLPINLVLMMGESEIELEYTPGNKVLLDTNKEINLPVKIVKLNIKPFTQDKLAIPYYSSETIKLKGVLKTNEYTEIEIQLVTRELMERLNDYVINSNSVDNKKKLCIVHNDRIYMLNKVSNKLGKNIMNIEECNKYINKTKTKMIKFNRNDELVEFNLIE